MARVVQSLNETAPRHPDSGEWAYEDGAVCHFRNPPGFERMIRQLAGLFVEDHPDKETLIDLGVQELVVRMLRMEAHRLLLEASKERAERDPLAAVEYAKQWLHEPLTVGDLAAVAYVSEPTFYRYFRDEFGQTPFAFLTEQRIRRARHLPPRGLRRGACHRVLESEPLHPRVPTARGADAEAVPTRSTHHGPRVSDLPCTA